MNLKSFSILAALIGAATIPAFSQQKDIKLPPEATEFWEPEPRVVTPGASDHLPPSDAIVLFDGKNLDQWKSQKDGGAAPWKIEDGAFTVVAGTGGIESKESFGDAQIHLEWRSPSEVKGTSQGRGNSGFFLMGKYEIQILDSYENRTYSNGQAASVYKQTPPLVNAMRPPGEWNTYDIIFTAPRFNKDGMVISAARVTVIHNGVLVQNNVEIKGPTEYIGIPNYKAHEEELPYQIQDHGNPVSFRNIWVRKLN